LIGLMAATMFAFVACDDEPTQQEANEEFCDATAEFVASLRVVEDLDRDSTLEEIEEARDRVVNAHDAMIAASQDVVDTRLDEFEEAWEELRDAVQDLDADATLDQALDDIDEELQNASTEAAQLLNDVNCSGVGDEGDSEE
jgi:hypothetical protein